MVRFSRTSFIGRVLYAATASVLSVVAVALASGTGEQGSAPTAGIEVAQLTGSLTAGEAPAGTVLEVGSLSPGRSADGTVTVANRGASGGLLTLSAPEATDAPGSGGGALSKRLQVTVLDVTGAAPELVYSGAVAAMKPRTLGYIRAGQERSFLVGATFIPGGAPASAAGGDDLYAGGSARLALQWGAMTAFKKRPAPAAADEAAPKPKIVVPGRQDVLGQGHLNVRVLCDEPCTAGAELTAAAAKAPAATAADRSASGSADLTLDLPPALQSSLRRRLAAGRTVVFAVTVTTRDAAGNEASATRRVGLAPTP